MNKEDLLQIKGIVTEAVSEAFDVKFSSAFDEKFSNVMEHNLIPQFDLLHERIDKVENRLDRVENKLDNVEKKIDTQLVSKSFLEDQFDNFRIDHGLKYKPAT